jgi:ABC-type bacteriocin/lantibiotic exporter with double-glycine peptidase domain
MKELESDLELLGSLTKALDKRTKSGSSHANFSVLTALQNIKERYDIPFVFRDQELKESSASAIIEDVCNRSSVRFRKVKLTANWKKCDSGILIITSGDSEAYNCFYGSGSYRIYSGAREIPEKPENVKPDEFGFVIYKSFGSRSVTFRNLIIQCVREVRQEIIRILVCNAALGILSLFLPVMIGVIFQGMLPESNISRLKLVVMGLMVSSLAITVIQFVNKTVLLNIESKLNTYLQSATWDRLLSQPVHFFRRFPAGELAQRALGINTIRQLISGSTIASLIGSVLMIFYFMLLLYYSVPLAFLALMLIALFSTINLILLRKELRFQEEVHQLNGELSGEMVGYINAVSKMKQAASESMAVRRWTELFASEKKAEYNAARFINWVEIINIVSPLISGLVLYAVTVYMELGIGTATFIAFHATFTMFLAAGISFSSSLLNFFKALPLFHRLQPIVESGSESRSATVEGSLTGSVALRDVTFKYEGQSRLLLDRVDLYISPGEFVGITGSSGCGKSTIIRLLLGFNEPNSGSVCLDDYDLAKVNMQSARKEIGVVLQSDGIMQGSILDNIRGSGKYSVEQVEQAVAIADLTTDIQQLPMGLNTMIPHGGGSFSGGQLQRILIARAVVGNPKILIMDEATSALDAISQEKISRALDKLPCTRIVIAHRLSTLNGADRILEMKDGKLTDANIHV